MLFRVVDIEANSRIVTFIFCNEDTFKLRVKTHKKDMFLPFALYDINITREFIISTLNVTDSHFHFSHLGVVVRKTRKSIHIQCGGTHWMFPIILCNYNPGTDVWINVVYVNEYSNVNDNYKPSSLLTTMI